MTEQTWVKVYGLMSDARHDFLRKWFDNWQLWPGASPRIDGCLFWAKQLEELNDAQIELWNAHSSLTERNDAQRLDWLESQMPITLMRYRESECIGDVVEAGGPARKTLREAVDAAMEEQSGNEG